MSWFDQLRHALTGTPSQPARPEREDDEVEVTWLALPPYDIPGMAVVSGVLVENQGANDVEGVRIQVHYPGERYITHMEVISDDPCEQQGGTPRDAQLVLTLPLMRAGSRVVVYVAGHNSEPPKVSVRVLGVGSSA